MDMTVEEEKEFLKEIKKFIEENSDIEVALSKL